jgi:predicted nucleic acid-binding protein
VLIDEREGRATATRHNVPVTGVVGVLFWASSRGKIDLEAELDALREAGFGSRTRCTNALLRWMRNKPQ